MRCIGRRWPTFVGLSHRPRCQPNSGRVIDLFTVYPERLANPNPRFTLLLLIRMSSLWVLYMTVKNSSQLPDVKDRANLLLPFKKNL